MPGADAQSLIPKPNADDPEDVAWALSTAAALWKRGEYADAVSWIRKAAAAAGEVEADLRVIELAKAAAELATLVETAEAASTTTKAAAPSAESIDAMEIVEPVVPDKKEEKKPPKPPPKKPEAPRPSASVPAPSVQPAKVQRVITSELEVPVLESPIEEEEVAPASVRRIDSRMPPGLAESSARIPQAAPALDVHPTPPESPAVAPKPAVAPPASPAAAAAGTAVKVPRPQKQKAERLKTAVMIAPAIDLRESARPATSASSAPQVAIPQAPKVAIPQAPAAPQIAPRRAPSVNPLAAAKVESERPPPKPGSMTETHEGIGPASVPPPPTKAGKGAIDLSRFEALADIPDDERGAILALGEMVALLPDEETTAPYGALIVHGDVEVRAQGYASTLEIVGADQMRLFAPTPPAQNDLVLVGGKRGARLLALPADAIARLKNVAPWVVQDLEPACDDLHVVAGALLGEIGRRLDVAVLTAILIRAETMRLEPGAVVCRQGELVRALVVLGAGALVLRVGDAVDAPEIGRIEPGEILFSNELLARGKAPSTVRAGEEGALVLVATRAATEELMIEYPPLLEILAE